MFLKRCSIHSTAFICYLHNNISKQQSQVLFKYIQNKKFQNKICRPGMSLKVSRKAGDITMAKNTLYDSGEYYTKRSSFYIVLWASFYCIPDIIKVSARHVFGRKNTSASMLRIYKNKSISPLRALDSMPIISASTCFAVRFPIDNQHSI